MASVLGIPARFARGLKTYVWEEGWAWLAGLLVLRFGYAFVHLWRTAAGPSNSLLIFGMISLIVLVAPGLFVLRLSGYRDDSFLNRCVMVVGLSLGITTAVVFGLYFVGAYYRWSLIVILVVFSAAGIWGAVSLRPVQILREVRAGWQSADWLERTAWIFFAGYFTTSFEFAVGRPFTSWDAVVSWDKWGCDMAERSGLGLYNLGGYPQLLPTVYSIYYKISGSFLDGLPDEQLLLHGLIMVFPLLLFLALIRLSRLLGAPWVLAVLLLFGNERFEVWVGDGYADIPATAFHVLSLVALLGLLRNHWSCRNELFAWVILAVLLFGAGFTKAHGLVWILCLGMYTIVHLHREHRLARTGPALAVCATVTCLLLVPFYLHQVSLDHHFLVAENQPRLHTMELGVAHALVSAGGALRTGYGFFVGYQPLLAPTMVRSLVVLLATLFALLSLFALRQRHARPWWIMVTGLSALWLFTTSYDVRNLFPALSLLSVLAGIGLSQLLALWPRPSRWVSSVISLLVILTFCGNFVVKRSSEISNLVRPYTNLSFGLWSTPKKARLHVLNPEWDAIARILNQCPITRRAKYIYCRNSFCRYLGGRGAYGYRDYGLEDLADGDLLLNESQPNPDTAWFTPIASLDTTSFRERPSPLVQSPRWGMLASHDAEPFKELCMHHPNFQHSRYRVQNPQSVDVTSAGDATSTTLQGQGTVDVRIEALQGMRPGDSVVVRITIDGDAEEVTVAAHPSLLPTNELSRQLLSTPVPGGVHYLLWLDGDKTIPSREILLQLHKRSTHPLVIRDVSVAS